MTFTSAPTGTLTRLRGTLLAFSLVCVNLAMLPCSMAAHGGTDAAVDAPVHAVETTGHHGGHDVPEAGHCLADAPDCCQLDGVRSADRSQKTAKGADADPVISVPAASTIRLPDPGAVTSYPPVHPPDTGRGQPRKHLIDCIFLD